MRLSTRRNLLFLAAAVTLLIAISILLSSSANADTDSMSTTYQLTVEVDDEEGMITAESDGSRHVSYFNVDEVSVSGGRVSIGKDAFVQDSQLVIEGAAYRIDNLRVSEILHEDDLIRVVFKHRESPGSTRRNVPRNRISVAEKLYVEYDEFVRGDVIGFGCQIEIDGEVNRNVVALFGDVRILDDGIVRSNVVALNGRVFLDEGSAVYGDVAGHKGVQTKGKVRARVATEGWGPQNPDFIIEYDRVDGLELGGGFTLADPDSMLPMVYGNASYAFAAKRLHYTVGAHQRLLDKYSVSFGGSFFRNTNTDDYWLSSTTENSIIAAIASEDFRDYYEEEGGKVYATFNPGYDNEVGVGYKFTELAWMDHHPKLWSLFGGSKDFRGNFSSLPDSMMDSVRNQLDSKLGEMAFWYTYDTRDYENDPFNAWYAHVEYLTAGDRLKGDNDFDRFTAEVRRYQSITYMQNINVRAKYGIAGRDVPVFRQFYLGGMRTIRGLRHKSIYGEQMFLVNIEYVMYFPKTSIETALLFDIGKVTSRNQSIFSDGDYRSSIGLRIGFDEGVGLEVAKSLDDADESVKLWVLLERSF
jgi:hypothetical protein